VEREQTKVEKVSDSPESPSPEIIWNKGEQSLGTGAEIQMRKSRQIRGVRTTRSRRASWLAILVLTNAVIIEQGWPLDAERVFDALVGTMELTSPRDLSTAQGARVSTNEGCRRALASRGIGAPCLACPARTGGCSQRRVYAGCRVRMEISRHGLVRRKPTGVRHRDSGCVGQNRTHRARAPLSGR
jgi:hypothetical protein